MVAEGGFSSSSFQPAVDATQRLGTTLERVGGSFKDQISVAASAFENMVESSARFAAHVGMAAGAAGIAGITYGVAKLNAQLEDSRIGIGATLNAFGATDTLQGGLEASGRLLEKMRQDAKALPGEFGDLKQFFSLGL